MKKLLIFCLAFAISSTLLAQNFQFKAKTNIPVYNFSGDSLLNPFAGGMWAPQFFQMDLNKDGLQDLVVYNRSTDALNTYLKINKNGSYFFQYAPEYEFAFPQMKDWFFLKDYNADGRADIFTSANGGVKVFNQAAGNPLQFAKKTDLILADYGFGLITNAYTYNPDIHGFNDVDDDGDIDIISFKFNYSTMMYYESLSMDSFGIPDSLNYFVNSHCWGRVAESLVGDEIVLGLNSNCLKDSFTNHLPQKAEHVGSTILVFDPNKDQKKDLLIGDVSFKNMFHLQNISSGTLDSIVLVDTIFPSYDKPVDLLFPAAFEVDFNEDGRQDLFVATNDWLDAEPEKQLSLYENYGNGPIDSFRFIQDNFLLDEAIDYGYFSAPTTFDYDGDGDEDLILATMNKQQKGILKLFENQGTNTNPEYHLIDTNYLFLTSNGYFFPIPAFGDLDGDGDKDLLLGNELGTLIFYENIANPGNAPRLVFRNNNFQNIDVGANSAPEIHDINGDGLMDLVIGEYKGQLHYFENQGSMTNPSFPQETNPDWGEIRINEFFSGYASPEIIDLNQNGLYDLIVGSESGIVYFYPDVELNPLDSFVASQNNFYEPMYNQAHDKDFGTLAIPCILQLNGDSLLDLIVGTYRGGLLAFEGQNFISTNVFNPELNNFLTLYPNPNRGMFILQFNDFISHPKDILRIYSMQGKLIDEVKMTGNAPTYTYKNTEISDGIYLLEYQSFKLQKSIKKKIVVVRQ